jgi:hypothetical protein
VVSFINHLPARSGAIVPVLVHEIPLPYRETGRCRRWMEQVHEPFIAPDQTRCDRTWDWRWQIPLIAFGGGLVRRPRLFQLCAGLDDYPIGMVALLENERWVDDEGRSAVYVWYLSAAPRTALTQFPGVGLVGRATLDLAVTISLNGAPKGRLWLHADPEGGDELMAWYGAQGLSPVSRDARPTLPGAVVRPRRNDGRYFCLIEARARAVSRDLNRYRS